jgi:hypothetical protein
VEKPWLNGSVAMSRSDCLIIVIFCAERLEYSSIPLFDDELWSRNGPATWRFIRSRLRCVGDLGSYSSVEALAHSWWFVTA